MQFIDFKKEHFTHDEETGSYFIEIPKDEIDFGDIKVQEKKQDGAYSSTSCELVDESTMITIKMETPADIRVSF
ncbi:hypothetical protein MKJ01_02590 [Chryseobacterium sp. SSA4.19]|uniref:hypothetical protein n=1 Tax=Chryseobacterium sp. SSA4.19 TaxID=2919915 RepID=UPI001F4E46AB|nr:hypothetical protein [Chryseobacterium sp. SSA4.19]MCJ8152649.1 hypothetical protein [Chryseobacterium sp. SSA4.19]